MGVASGKYLLCARSSTPYFEILATPLKVAYFVGYSVKEFSDKKHAAREPKDIYVSVCVTTWPLYAAVNV